jgi:hypothetical protein
MGDKKYERVNWVRIGSASGVYTQIDRLLYYTDKIVTPGSTGEIIPIETVNLVKPSGVSGSFKHYLIEITIDSDNYEAFYTQNVINGGAGAALIDATDNSVIDYFAVQLVEDDGSVVTVTFLTDTVAVVGRRSRYSNRDNIEFQPTTYMLVCWGTRTES